MKSFFILLTGAVLAATSAAQRPDRAEELRQALQQPRPATPQQQKQQSQRALSEQERAELRRQLAEARDAGRSTRHSVR